jgi:hypothetical protein
MELVSRGLNKGAGVGPRHPAPAFQRGYPPSPPPKATTQITSFAVPTRVGEVISRGNPSSKEEKPQAESKLKKQKKVALAAT